MFTNPTPVNSEDCDWKDLEKESLCIGLEGMYRLCLAVIL